MAVDYFLKIDGIPGESGDSKHKEEIELESWSWSEKQEGSFQANLGGGAGKVNMEDFKFTMKTNKASPKLFIACADGHHIKNAILTCRKAGKGQQEYYIWKFTDLLVSSFSTGGSQGDVIPTEEITLNYTKIEVEYKEQKADGSLGPGVKAGYNLKENKAV
jgi:type VI secretion system secreted protein Hcp